MKSGAAAPHSTTLRALGCAVEFAAASWSAALLRRFASLRGIKEVLSGNLMARFRR
jgi:hypothetical protein